MLPPAISRSLFVSGISQAGLSVPAGVSIGHNGRTANLANASVANNTVFAAQFNASMVAQAEMMMYAAMLETVERNLVVERTLENDVQTIEAMNAQMNQVNDRVLPVLRTLTSQDLGPEPESWRKWWTDQLGYVYQSSQPESKPTITEMVGLPDVSRRFLLPQIQFRTHTACFAAGTLVQTSTARADRHDPGRRPGTVSEHVDRPARFRARGGDPPEPALFNAQDQNRRRNHRGNRDSSVLETRQGMDHGPRAYSRRSPAHGRWSRRD